ncbi:GNAT family N-acetyltransferase [Pengzhenrongella frigida]|uniref:GNAT family N-acetyltransferase n=1 Tax=Pengzhenrongella frigida TaxID=1259133 RepID=A0A4V1ZHL0_9MICO|nr:GNAT family N-acetyltransferase [Cellulomonas sp. HLT2-17]RYV52414.1 GNAT family N-acetyltransferase [Cellulomonas sp. HLT2-17]
MGRWREATLDATATGGRMLHDADLPAAAKLCARLPVESVLAANRIDAVLRSGLSTSGGQLWGFETDGELRAVCWAGANLVPVVPPGAESALDAFAALARAQGRRCSSIVGESGAALGLWARLSPVWSRPREIRANQPSLAIDHEPLVEPDPFVRRSLAAEYDLILPACVQMFTEEVGYSPASGVNGPYETRVRSLIAEDRSFVRFVRGTDGVEVAFKAELGAVAGGVAQVQGVWVAPALRGRGLSEQGMAAVVAMTRADVAPTVSLYVNDYNTRALAAYFRVGFRQVGTFATVLF